MNGRERPTVVRSRLDLSPAVDDASAAPADRTEPCVCGGIIAVRRRESVAAAVRLHNQSALHAEWRWRRALEEAA